MGRVEGEHRVEVERGGGHRGEQGAVTGVALHLEMTVALRRPQEALPVGEPAGEVLGGVDPGVVALAVRLTPLWTARVDAGSAESGA